MKRRIILYAFLVFSILLVADLLLYYFYKISFAGYYSDTAVFWGWLISSVFVIIYFWKKIWAKIYFGLMVLGIIGSILPMMIPFFAIIISQTSEGLYLDKNLNEKYRAQIAGYSVLGFPDFQFIEKHGVFEQEILKCSDYELHEFFRDNAINLKMDDYLEFRDAKNILLKQDNDKNLTIEIIFSSLKEIITFNKDTGKILKFKIEKTNS